MTPHPQLRSSRGGHSLIELLTVLVIIGVLVSLAGPAMREYIVRNRTQRALDRVAADIAYTRILALRSGARAELRFLTTSSYSILIQSTPPRTVREVVLGTDFTGVSITPPTADSRLVFDSRGLLLTLGTGTLVARIGTVADSARLTPTGRVYRAF